MNKLILALAVVSMSLVAAPAETAKKGCPEQCASKDKACAKKDCKACDKKECKAGDKKECKAGEAKACKEAPAAKK